MKKRPDYRTEEYRAMNRERMRLWREKNPDKYAASQKKYREAHRDACRARSRANKEGKRKWWIKNPGYYKSYYRKNKDRIRLLSRFHASKHLARKRVEGQKYRALKRGNGGSYTLLEWNALCRKYDFRCLRCGKRAPDIRLTVDHVIPLELGGTNDIDNLQPLCFECNSGKGARTVDYRPETTQREQYVQLSLF